MLMAVQALLSTSSRISSVFELNDDVFYNQFQRLYYCRASTQIIQNRYNFTQVLRVISQIISSIPIGFVFYVCCWYTNSHVYRFIAAYIRHIDQRHNIDIV